MCKHSHILIEEIGTVVTQHLLEDGKWEHNNYPDSYSDTLYVECYDCGLKRAYPRSARPKWLQKKFEEAIALVLDLIKF